MDTHAFDHLTRDLSTKATRRNAIRILTAAAAGSLSALFAHGNRPAEAARDCCPYTYPNLCSRTCVNLRTDPNNCGACGHHCSWGSICRHGICDRPSDFTQTAIVISSQTPTRTPTKTNTPTRTPTKTPTNTPTQIPTPPPSDTCSDDAKNGLETDVDCGGPICPKCAPGQQCLQASDCDSGICTGGFCEKPTCSDYVKNGKETDVDCGGPYCPPCDAGRQCTIDTDCTTLHCDSGRCSKVGCADGVKNGMETDIDCGGPECAKCASGKSCNIAADCQSGLCENGTCTTNTCLNLVQDGLETDVDCGGPTCPTCKNGKHCLKAGDCTSNYCLDGVCRPFTCADTIKDGDESDVDCGGSCAPCATGKNCNYDWDCVSGLCDMILHTCVACVTPEFCYGTDTECQTRTCVDGKCGMSFAAPETPISTQIPGDCMKYVCDGTGNVLQMEDNSDLPATGPCCIPICIAGMPNATFRDSSYLCNVESQIYCSGQSCSCK